MPEPMKKPLTETVVIRFEGPEKLRAEAVRALSDLGFTDVSGSVPWREAFGCLKEEDLPGAALRGARGKEGVTQARLAGMTGIPQRHISEMENGKRPIGRETAKKLGRALNIGYKVFL